MGPAATADMLEKFVELRHASCDQQHIPLIVSSIPDIPVILQHVCYPAGLRHTLSGALSAYAGRRRGGVYRYPMQHCALLV